VDGYGSPPRTVNDGLLIARAGLLPTTGYCWTGNEHDTGTGIVLLYRQLTSSDKEQS
jgi:hypothetical protein